MTAELFLGGWDLGDWDRVLLPGLTAALVSFVLILWTEWLVADGILKQGARGREEQS